MKKKFNLEDMNGQTENDKKSCSLTDMNCLGEDEDENKKPCVHNDGYCVDKEKK